MSQIIPIFSEAEILSAALAVSQVYTNFKLKEVRRRLLSDAGRTSCKDYTHLDLPSTKVTGAKVSAILRKHPDLFGCTYSDNGRVHSFHRAGAV